MATDANGRADIPALLSIDQQQQNKHIYKSSYRQRWGWQDDQRPKLTPNEITKFVRTYAWPKETELALQCLFEANYDVSRAVEIIHEARRQKLRLNRDESERIHMGLFEKSMVRHGKDFHLVKRRLGRNVTTRELVNKFYLWKIRPEYEKWHDGQREKKRKREAKRLQKLHPAVGQNREYCEVCLKDGKLLCCDGCERACHLNCIRPALLDVPEGDWFCSRCRDAASAIKCHDLGVPDSDVSKSTSKPKTQTNGNSLKGGSILQSSCYARDTKKIADEKYFATEKCSKRSRPRASSKYEDAPDRFIAEDLDKISDITTESESDGGVANVFLRLM
ncbi:unnamed protein product [Peronospora belbahrii]|uniref:PHD-type domain-containing protein n=1 Tax=Peronospora belbahrii TaxID=622444 RepID=A0ABN8DEP6_9STRA|nr:unnamed protein product [Peronospora belbahrii]